MKHILSIGLLLALALQYGISQESREGENIVIGKTYTFESDKLAGSWEVQVSLPPSYYQTEDVYPVVYALHGNFYFKFAVGGLQRLMEFGNMPEAIIVGISNESNGYFAYGSQGADQFLDFMEEEIFPFVDENFRIHKDRTVLGWHYTSGFILHTLVQRPYLFQHYIPASSYLQGYDVNQIRFEALEQMAEAQPELKKKLYFGALSNERSVTVASLSLDSLLQQKAPGNLEWEFHLFEPDYDQVMDISVYRLWQAGLKTVYAPYRQERLENENIGDFIRKEGVDGLIKHYNERARRYGGSAKPPELIALIRLARISNNFILFEQLMDAFGTDFSDVNLNRTMGFALFYLQYGAVNKALALYEHINTFYPNSVSVHASMAATRAEAGDVAGGIKAYEKAIVLAGSQEDGRLANLEKKLSELRQK